MAAYVVTAPLAIVKLKVGGERYFYRGAPVAPSEADEGHLAFLVESKMIAEVEAPKVEEAEVEAPKARVRAAK